MNQEARIRNQGKIKSFTDLHVWQEGHQFVLKIYKTTKHFPKEDMLGLTNQLRRAAVLFTSNIAEGFSRLSYKEKSKFYSMSLGSITEVQNQLLVARDMDYISKELFNELAEKTILLNKMTNGLIKKSRMRSLVHAS